MLTKAANLTPGTWRRAVRKAVERIDADATRKRAAAARKDLGPLTDTSPDDRPAELASDWRATYPDHLAELARSPADEPLE